MDRSALGDQTEGEFTTTKVIGAKTFADTFGLKGLSNVHPDDATRVHICTIQGLVRRFLLHTLPDGFHRIRHIGFLANGHRATKLALCRALLGAAEPSAAACPESGESLPDRNDAPACPLCGGIMRTTSLLPPSSADCADRGATLRTQQSP